MEYAHDRRAGAVQPVETDEVAVRQLELLAAGLQATIAALQQRPDLFGRGAEAPKKILTIRPTMLERGKYHSW